MSGHLVSLGIVKDGDHYVAICRDPEQRSRVAAAIADLGLQVDSRFDKDTGNWTVFSTGVRQD